ncbi:MAG: glycoside hydrolase family 32 protein [SAR202 cluster bacterium]|nr:glycoside hydrolase family 32 protein [SAR202 cluster bacterium]
MEHFTEKINLLRKQLNTDKFRPLYHYQPPANWTGDPRSGFFMNGLYHMFFQNVPYQSSPPEPADGSIHWGHAASKDFIHWTDFPVALTPSPDGPDNGGCFYGNAVNNEGIPTLIYYGVRGGICIATSDDDMITWDKSVHNPVIPAPTGDEEWKVHDPFVWKNGDYWYCINGSQTGEGRQIGTSYDAGFMFRSKDMITWEYMYPLYEPGKESDLAVPDFFKLGDKHCLLFASHTRGAQYYIGTYANNKFVPESHGRMNFTRFSSSHDRNSPDDMMTSGDMQSPFSWNAPDGRRIMISWVIEGRTREVQTSSGWSGTMSLPREISLSDDNTLEIRPLSELKSLRKDQSTLMGIHLNKDKVMSLGGVGGNCIEIEAEFQSSDSGEIGLKVCCSRDGSEETVITYSYEKQTLTLDVSKSTLSKDFVGTASQEGPLTLGDGESLKLRVFIDRSVVEVFANDRQCLTKRIYPSREDSIRVRGFANKKDSTIKILNKWNMSSIWPS